MGWGRGEGGGNSWTLSVNTSHCLEKRDKTGRELLMRGAGETGKRGGGGGGGEKREEEGGEVI